MHLVKAGQICSIFFGAKYKASETRVPLADIRAWYDGRGQAFPDPNPNIGK